MTAPLDIPALLDQAEQRIARLLTLAGDPYDGAKQAAQDAQLLRALAEALARTQQEPVVTLTALQNATARGDAAHPEAPTYKSCAICGVVQPCRLHGRTPVSDADYDELTRDVLGAPEARRDE